MYRHIRSERGLTLVEVLVAMVVLALVAGTGVYAWRAMATAPAAATEAARGTVSTVQLLKLLDEIRSAVAFTEIAEGSMTFVASTVSSAQAQTHTDPATGQQVTLRRYTVRYAFQNGTLYRDTGEPPGWGALREGVVGLPSAPNIGRPAQAPSVPFPGPRPAPVNNPGPADYSTVFSGVWLTKSGTSGLATSRVWSQGQWEDRCVGHGEHGDCWHEWVVRYYAAGPLWIKNSRFNSIANNPQRDSAGNVVGYYVGDGVWATPGGLEHIRHHRGWVCTWPTLFTCNHWEHVHWVLGGSNELTQREYNTSKNSPMAARAVSAAWLAQRQAYEQYQHDLAVWHHRYNTWVGYYREYGRWQRQAMATTVAVGVVREVETAVLAARPPEQIFRPRTQPQLSGDARPVGSFAALRFEYFDRQGNRTTDPNRVHRVVIHYQVNNVSASTGVVIGGEGASGSATRPVDIPTRCAVDPAYCPPPPPPDDPTRREFEKATDREPVGSRAWYGRHEASDGSVVYVRCEGGRCQGSSADAFNRATDRVNNRDARVGVVDTVSGSRVSVVRYPTNDALVTETITW